MIQNEHHEFELRGGKNCSFANLIKFQCEIENNVPNIWSRENKRNSRFIHLKLSKFMAENLESNRFGYKHRHILKFDQILYLR